MNFIIYFTHFHLALTIVLVILCTVNCTNNTENLKEPKKSLKSLEETALLNENSNVSLQNRARRQPQVNNNDYGRQPPGSFQASFFVPPPVAPQFQASTQFQNANFGEFQPQFQQPQQQFMNGVGVESQLPQRPAPPPPLQQPLNAPLAQPAQTSRPLQKQLGLTNPAQKIISPSVSNIKGGSGIPSQSKYLQQNRVNRLKAQPNSHSLVNNGAAQKSGVIEGVAHKYYFPPRQPLPLPTCFHNPTGYACCNPMLNDLMVETYTELESQPRFHTCNINAIATMLQNKAEKRFNTSFETIAALDDFAQKIHFNGDLVCKVELGGKYMLAYGSVKNVAKKLAADKENNAGNNNINELAKSSKGRKKREIEFIGPKNAEIYPLNHISRKYSMWI